MRSRVKGGRFKMPFGLEQNTGVSDLDFAYRALGSTAHRARPRSRRDGVRRARPGELRSRRVRRRWRQCGVERAAVRRRKARISRTVGPSFAVRAHRRSVPRCCRSRSPARARTSASPTRTRDVPEGLNSLRGEGVWGEDFFERVYVKGRRQRLGAQFDWTPGPTALRAEWMQSREQRKEQSNRNEDLSDFIGTAWYVSRHVVRDRRGQGRQHQRRGVRCSAAASARSSWRSDTNSWGSTAPARQGTAFTNPRADHLMPNTRQALDVRRELDHDQVDARDRQRHPRGLRG